MSSTTSRAVAVTPSGNGLDVWASTIRRAVTEHAEELRKGPGATLVVLSAHPDDETLGAGRLIAWWTRHAGPARAITLTAGEACLSAVGPSLVGMGARRLAEWAGAVGTLRALPEPCWGAADGRVAASCPGTTSSSRPGDTTRTRTTLPPASPPTPPAAAPVQPSWSTRCG